MEFGKGIEVRSRYNRGFTAHQKPVLRQHENSNKAFQVPWYDVSTMPAPGMDKGLTAQYHPSQIYPTARQNPWHVTAGADNTFLTPLQSQPLTKELMNTGYFTSGLSTEPLKFPNLVTVFERNPAHAMRTALYTRYTPYEWAQSALTNYNEADTNRQFSERVRMDAVRVMRETDERTARNQRDAGRRIGERITDTTFWRNENNTELERLMAEIGLLSDTKRALEKCLQDLEGPLHIAEECLYHREGRSGIDLVHDEVEKSLLREVQVIRNWMARMRAMIEKVIQQQINNRAAQNELEKNINSKEGALGVDNLCHQLSNTSRGINYYGGIEEYDPSTTSTDAWAEHSSHVVQRSQAERARSSQIRSDSDNLLSTCASEVWDAWNTSNNALMRRSAETLEAKSKLQLHLHKLQQEIFDVEKNIEMLRKAIVDKSAPMKVAQTRLEARTHRPFMELVHDMAQERLVKEVKEMQDSVDMLHRKLRECEAQHQQLLKTKSALESDLNCKVGALFIDREKCMGIRRAYPVTATIKL